MLPRPADTLSLSAVPTVPEVRAPDDGSVVYGVAGPRGVTRGERFTSDAVSRRAMVPKAPEPTEDEEGTP